MLKGKKIILGITGSIAAYKAPRLISLLCKEGAEVQPIPTPCGLDFVTPLTLSAISKRPIHSDLFDKKTGEWYNHIKFGLEADAFVIAPATANTIAKMASGICDNLLLASYFSTRCTVFVAPAMDLDMLKHPTVQKNLDILTAHKNIVIEPTEGELASGLEGKGRMEEPENIVVKLKDFFFQYKPFKGKTFLITAGPTYEKIDPVRFIGNFSSGKMGFAIAEELANSGASIKLITGPTVLKTKHPNIERINVTTAQEMYNISVKEFSRSDGAILVAAVSDFKPANNAKEKIKSETKKTFNLKLVPTKDIAETLGKSKNNKLLIGFALETTNERENALKKIKKKNFDFIVLNSLKDTHAGFQYDTNKINIIHKNGRIKKFPLKNKKDVAVDIVNEIITYLQ